jgi:uncharacterized membrane protein
MMVGFHFVFDLNFLGIYRIQVYSGWPEWFAYSIGTIFLLLVGVSLTISYRRAKEKLDAHKLKWKYLKRGLQIFSFGLVITAVTMVYPGKGFVQFGILHCIGLSIIAAYVLLPCRWWNLVLGILIVIIGIIVAQFTYPFPWLAWLGLVPVGFYSIDYFPILPWFGVVLIGVFAGNVLYPNHMNALRKKDAKSSQPVRFGSYLGRHSLVIYLLHQPIIFALLYPIASSV